MNRLIVNADDFGLHPTVNRGIIYGHLCGLITSTTLIAAGAAAEDAAELAWEVNEHSERKLGVGVHLTLVAERSVLPAAEIPSLIDPATGLLWPNHAAFIRRYVTGRIRRAEVLAECDAQIRRVFDLLGGAHYPPTHIDSHQHLHVLPGLAQPIAELAQRYGIAKMRCPAEPHTFDGGYRAPLARRVARDGLTLCAQWAASDCPLLSPDVFYGMLAGGHLSVDRLLAIVAQLPSGTSEIMVHPGTANLNALYPWDYHWPDELAAVTDATVVQYVRSSGIQLVSFSDL